MNEADIQALSSDWGDDLVGYATYEWCCDDDDAQPVDVDALCLTCAENLDHDETVGWYNVLRRFAYEHDFVCRLCGCELSEFEHEEDES